MSIDVSGDRALLEAAARALEDALNEIARNTCTHDETFRGGAIWEICLHCDMKWADDQGGKPEYAQPPQIIAAYDTLAAIRAALKPQTETDRFREALEKIAREDPGGVFGGIARASLPA
jgi:hypothetical protein